MAESDEEELPPLASMLLPQPSVTGRWRPLGRAGGVVVVSSGSEEEDDDGDKVEEDEVEEVKEMEEEDEVEELKELEEEEDGDDVDEVKELEEDGDEVEELKVNGGEDEEEEEVIEVIPLAERIERRVEGRRETAFESPQAGDGVASGGDSLCAGADPLGHGSSRRHKALVTPGDVSCGRRGGTRGADGPSLCPLPASRSGSSILPGRPLASSETSPAPKKPKYSPKDREAIAQAVWQRRKEREERRRQREEEKERKRALAMRLKALRPGECQKYITVVLDSVLLQVEGGGHVLSALQAANYSCVVEDQAVPCSITWRRKSVSAQAEGEEWTEEPNVLVLLRLEEFLSMIRKYKQETLGYTDGQGETLQSYVAHTMEKMPGKILALAVAGVENYFRSQSKKTLRQAAASGKQGEEHGKRGKRKSKDSGLEITKMDMEEALVDLQLDRQMQVSSFDTWQELGEFARMFSKAVAEAPYKREQENTGFSFYLEKSWCGGVKVDRSGKGLLQVWKRQIQQFNRVSPAMAEAIVSAYPSPLLLLQAYDKCSSEKERVNMLANILVHRGDGVTATARRIGPELSRRIYLQMTSHDPNLCLDGPG
ncbi:crossover junction endonuclease EME1 [Cuculus canorus]|uniref:crossover junction endonuclease EME1 n=1 Tax=Cuculus canorus TaxID=55661 RepID=UPI0023AB03CD|nr:crossover junction endonuclease EME1 [Cuculus canorus]